MSNRYLLGRIVQWTGRIVRPFPRSIISRAYPRQRVYKETGGKETGGKETGRNETGRKEADKKERCRQPHPSRPAKSGFPGRPALLTPPWRNCPSVSSAGRASWCLRAD